MPDIDSTLGTREVGRWTMRAIGDGSAYWRSIESDPYHRLVAEGMQSTDAKSYVAEKIASEGEGYEFLFVGGLRMTMHDRIEQWQTDMSLSDNPEAYAKEFLKSIVPTEAWETLARLAMNNNRRFICINPGCLYAAEYLETDNGRGSCPACGYPTSVRCDDISDGDALVDAAGSLSSMSVPSIRTKAALLMGALSLTEHKDISLALYSSTPNVVINRKMKQIHAKGRHFIKARSNRLAMREAGWVASGGENGDLYRQINRLSTEMLEMAQLLASDPEIIIDMQYAERFRQEYIDEGWENEFISFIGKLRDRGILLVDSRGVDETVEAIYRLAQRRGNFKTIIKRDGSLVFPTQKVLENITPHLINRAFAHTEHAAYSDASEVFRLVEGEA